MFKRVLLCDDGSQAGRKALQRGAALATLLKAEVYLLTMESQSIENAAVWASVAGASAVMNPISAYEVSTEESLRYLKQFGLQVHAFRARGDVIEAIAAHARRLAADLIVVGHYPQARGGRWWSGTERRSLAERVNCCVLIAVSD